MGVMTKENKYAVPAMAGFAIILFSVALLTNGTGDGGDSIMHYLFARYAFIHPEFFFNHWAKPVYVLIMSPFAQFGPLGAKLFNAFLSCIAIWFTYLIAKELKYKWALAIFVLSFFFKTFMTVTLSGLTEPLCNAMLCIAIYLAFTERYAAAAIIVSFLPFVRSEGLFLCGTFSLYLVMMRQWKVLPLLLTGHIIYSIVGYPSHHDILWVWHDIPYGLRDTHYGHGNWLHFAEQMPQIAGVVNSILLSAGLIFVIISSIYLLYQRKWDQLAIQRAFIALVFVVFFLMHTSFWALGIFNSYGMTRVFAAVSGVMILTIVYAIECIDLWLSKWFKWHMAFTILSLSILFPVFAFGSSPYAYDRFDFNLYPDQIMDQEAADYIKKNYPDYRTYHLFYDAEYLAVALDLDPFAPNKEPTDHLTSHAGKYPDKSMIIWDGWYADFEHGTHLETLSTNKAFKEVNRFRKPGRKDEMFRAVIFIKANP